MNHPLPSSFILHPTFLRTERKKKKNRNCAYAPPSPSHLKLFYSLYNRSATFQKRHPLLLPLFFLPFCLLFHARLMEATFRGSTSSRGSLTVSKTRENSLPFSRRGREVCSATIRSRQSRSSTLTSF